jgi:hypothetical protein
MFRVPDELEEIESPFLRERLERPRKECLHLRKRFLFSFVLTGETTFDICIPEGPIPVSDEIFLPSRHVREAERWFISKPRVQHVSNVVELVPKQALERSGLKEVLRTDPDGHCVLRLRGRVVALLHKELGILLVSGLRPEKRDLRDLLAKQQILFCNFAKKPVEAKAGEELGVGVVKRTIPLLLRKPVEGVYAFSIGQIALEIARGLAAAHL